MDKQAENAQKVADFLKQQEEIEKVYYLGHLEEGTPEYSIYKNQCSGPGAMVSFDIKGGEKEAFKFLNNLQLIKLAVSLGSTESLAQHPYTMTHAGVDQKHRDQLQITDKMIRLSIGVENVNDIIEDLKTALNSISQHSTSSIMDKEVVLN
jgi:methionine-gamma-lyase